GGGGDRLDKPIQAVGRMPQRDHPHHMRQAAAENKDSEQAEHPRKYQIATAAHEQHKRNRNQGVRKRNDAVRKQVELDQPWFTQAINVRHEIGGKQLPKEIEHVSSSPEYRKRIQFRWYFRDLGINS